MKKITSFFLFMFCLLFNFNACVHLNNLNSSNIVKATAYDSSEDSEDVALLTLFAFDGKSESKFGLVNLGHAFLSFENTSTKSLKFGNREIPAGKTTSLGTWSIEDHFGVWYNVESNYITDCDKYNGRVSITIGVTESDIEQITDFILNNDKWNYFRNCSYFSLNLWNIVASDVEVINKPLIYTVRYLVSEIKKFQNYEVNKSIPTEHYFGFFSNSEYLEYRLEIV